MKAKIEQLEEDVEIGYGMVQRRIKEIEKLKKDLREEKQSLVAKVNIIKEFGTRKETSRVRLS